MCYILYFGPRPEDAGEENEPIFSAFCGEDTVCSEGNEQLLKMIVVKAKWGNQHAFKAASQDAVGSVFFGFALNEALQYAERWNGDFESRLNGDDALS